MRVFDLKTKPFFIILLFLCVGLFFFKPAFANAPLFTIEGVEVDVTADSAVSAREQAFNTAQARAFQILAARMLSEREMENFELPDIDTISSLIQDFEIKNEKLSTVRYIAEYTFRFRDNAVNKFFARSGVEFTDVSSRPALVLPYYQKRDDVLLWSPFNVFMKAWNRDTNLGGLVPLILPLGDLQDVKDIQEEDGLDYRDLSMARMLDRYDAAEAIILVAIPDANLSILNAENEQATGSLMIQMYRTDRGRPEYVQPLTIDARTSETLGDMMDRAVDRVKKELRRNWKEKTAVQVTQTQAIKARASFSSLQEWARMQRALNRVYGLNDVILTSLKPNEANVELVFDGDANRLQIALEQANIRLLRPSYDPSTSFGYDPFMQTGGAEQVYELSFQGARSNRGEIIFRPEN